VGGKKKPCTPPVKVSGRGVKNDKKTSRDGQPKLRRATKKSPGKGVEGEQRKKNRAGLVVVAKGGGFSIAWVVRTCVENPRITGLSQKTEGERGPTIRMANVRFQKTQVTRKGGSEKKKKGLGNHLEKKRDTPRARRILEKPGGKEEK